MKAKHLMTCLLSAALLLLSVDASAFTYSDATKTARLAAVRDKIDLGSGPGKLEIGTAGMATVCVVITLNDPSAIVSGAAFTLDGFPKTVTATGTCPVAAEARIRDSNNTNVITGLTVGTSNANIVLDNTSINSSQSVRIGSFTFTHAP